MEPSFVEPVPQGYKSKQKLRRDKTLKLLEGLFTIKRPGAEIHLSIKFPDYLLTIDGDYAEVHCMKVILDAIYPLFKRLCKAGYCVKLGVEGYGSGVALKDTELSPKEWLEKWMESFVKGKEKKERRSGVVIYVRKQRRLRAARLTEEANAMRPPRG